ncbi:hypothetical protein B0H19DRAFT_1209274 [Mycena capillaripes]|nr:hypothetical protein B0H19DRAFT_1209274 [Mycena capillaripes]
MHLIWENLINNLTLLWTGDFKGLDQGQEGYELSKALWEAIASETASASDTIPSAYGSRVPNIAKDRPNVSAEMWSFWTLYLGAYAEIETIRTGFISWVKTYESVYFQKNIEQMSVCPLTSHALLHIAPGIKFCGPERYCESIQPGIRSRRFPWASIGRYVLEIAQLTQIKALYNVEQEVSLAASRGAVQDPSCILLPARSPQRQQNLRPVAATLSTRTGAKLFEVNAALRTAIIEEWGKERRIDSEAGDTMCLCSLGVATEDMWDATYVRVNIFRSSYAYHRIHLPIACPAPKKSGPTTYILAAIQACVLNTADKELAGLNIHLYSDEVTLGVVDITTWTAKKSWAIIDRSRALARPVWSGEDADS